MVPTDRSHILERPPTSRETAYLSLLHALSLPVSTYYFPSHITLHPFRSHFAPVPKSLCTRSEVIYDSFLSQFRGVK